MKRVTVRSEQDVHLLARRLDFHIFRGQKQDWPVKSRLVRVLESIEVDPGIWRNRENNVIREFAGKRHLHQETSLPQSDMITCCSLMQHYGAPTRLIDFTFSLYVALFFAVEDIEYKGDSIIWCLNEMKIRDEAVPRESVSTPDGNNKQRQYEIMRDQAAKIFASDPSHGDGLLLIEPATKNERHSRQQGCLLFPKQIDKDLSGILASNFSCSNEVEERRVGDFDKLNYDEIALKIVVPGKFRQGLMGSLWKMNINHGVLFPGIDGFCKSLFYYCSLYG